MAKKDAGNQQSTDRDPHEQDPTSPQQQPEKKAEGEETKLPSDEIKNASASGTGALGRSEDTTIH